MKTKTIALVTIGCNSLELSTARACYYKLLNGTETLHFSCHNRADKTLLYIRCKNCVSNDKSAVYLVSSKHLSLINS